MTAMRKAPKGKSPARAAKPGQIRRQNMLLQGGGAETMQDRGSLGTASQHTLNPYYNNNHFARWQEYVRWYQTAWEAKKIIDIPVQDSTRIPVELKGLDKDDEKRVWDLYQKLDTERQTRRILTQERLLGGSTILGIFRQDVDARLDRPLKIDDIEKGDLKALNVVDISRLSRPMYSNDPFAVDYDRIDYMLIDGREVNASRICILDGETLFNRSSQTMLENFRYNPCGFGESKLAPLYDLLIRVIGTQQGAYHLVNLSSVLIMSVAELRTLKAVRKSPALAKLEEVAEQISIYRAALVDGKDVELKQHSATFGSVPELVMSFLQILSAGSDIPATRFLGIAPGGLNATGESDLENYYTMLGSQQRSRHMPLERKLIDWIGASVFGGKEWLVKSKDLQLEYAPLWNPSELEVAQTLSQYKEVIKGLFEAGIIDGPSAVKELQERGVFKTQVQAGDFLTKPGTPGDDPFGGQGSFY